MHFDWDDLRYFLHVARAGTVSQAARKMGVDHSTIIRRIDALERALGARLFERSLRGYNLTQNGERLLSSAETIEVESIRVRREFQASGAGLGGMVRISSLEGFGNFFLAGKLPEFARSHPNLRLELLTLQQIVALSRREADITISLAPPRTGSFVREKLTDYLLFVYGAKSYLDDNPPIASRQDFASHRFCGYIDDLIFTRELDYMGELGKGVRAPLQSSSLHAQLEMACQGYGLCILPAYIASRRAELVPVLPEQAQIRRSYWMVATPDMAATPRLQAVRRFIRAEVANARSDFLGKGGED